ncbi:kinase domain protein (macronuclear) [Tetrahymena thermophila SB210]|uniref:Kinase domain protein n=1 Tax=Tetrahymena thermophila (strain SB210) TaxID=312017 RepID=I7M697_TETTS|nr:kinase domain protein [Tetrahymena thermophila SB210]EAR84808.1 kinase domain protein [Tetrahymena thermophila SB210]|eukprot:XP_001032471.1 kinase domain protein [Tetrahymena thermophila SB210]
MRKNQDNEAEDNIYLQYQSVDISKKCVKLENCGEGGFGTVDAYYDNNLQKVIAVKTVSRKTTYLQEKRRLINLKKQQLDFVNNLIGFCDQERILVFELGEATLLEIDDMFQDDGYTWREIDLIYIAWNLLVGLKYLREIKSFHGDISPNNIMFFMEKVKYIDLGSSEINKNNQYLQQYKIEFVNHEIRKNKANFKYSDEQITQNEIFALGKTLLYLALYNDNDKNHFIMDVDKKSQKQLIEMQKAHFYELVANDSLSNSYPQLKNLIIKMMYPFDIDLNDIDQNLSQSEDKEDSIKFKEPLKVKKLKKDESIIERKESNKRFQKVQGQMSVEEEGEDQEEQKIEFNQKTIEIQTHENNNQTVELGTVQLKTQGDKMEYEEDQDLNDKFCEDYDDDEEEDEDFEIDEYQIKNGKKRQAVQKKKPSNNIDSVLDEIIQHLEQILSKKYQNKANFSKVIEENEQIRVALFKIRQKRIDELLEKHDDPQRELVYLSTMSAEDWRKEVAQSMIQDILNSQRNQSVRKESIQKMIHEKILRIQMRILDKKVEIEDSFIDAIKHLYAICKNNKEYHSLIECNYTLFLIYSFLKLSDDAQKQLSLAEEKSNFADKYINTLTRNKIKDSSDENMNTIRFYVEEQLNELRNNNYDIIY